MVEGFHEDPWRNRGKLQRTEKDNQPFPPFSFDICCWIAPCLQSFGPAFSSYDNAYGRAKMWTQTYCQPQMCCQSLGEAMQQRNMASAEHATITLVQMGSFSLKVWKSSVEKILGRNEEKAVEFGSLNLVRFQRETILHCCQVICWAKDTYLWSGSGHIAGSSGRQQMPKSY